jgi:two-component system chemotaxis response regulator CheY
MDMERSLNQTGRSRSSQTLAPQKNMVMHMATAATTEKACRILIVEDDQDDIFLLKRAFDRARRILNRDIVTEEADNGLEAIFTVSREDLVNQLPDALVLDLNMPRMDGIKFLRSLRRSLLLRDLPVFVLTTTTAGSIHEEAMSAGADKIYVKPNDADTLLAIALEIVGLASERGSGDGAGRNQANA